MKKINDFLNEAGRHIISKRKYGEYPTETISTEAPVRNRILAFVAEKNLVTKSQLHEFMQTLSEDIGKMPSQSWISQNKHYFNISKNNEGETTYRLSNRGKRVLDSINKYESYKDSVRKEIEQETLAKQNKRLMDDDVDIDNVISRNKYKVNEKYFELINQIENKRINESKNLNTQINKHSEKHNRLLEFINENQPVSLKSIKEFSKKLNETEGIEIDLKFLYQNKDLIDRKINKDGTSTYSLTQQSQKILNEDKI